MKHRALVLELLLLRERYTVEEIRTAKRLLQTGEGWEELEGLLSAVLDVSPNLRGQSLGPKRTTPKAKSRGPELSERQQSIVEELRGRVGSMPLRSLRDHAKQLGVVLPTRTSIDDALARMAIALSEHADEEVARRLDRLFGPSRTSGSGFVALAQELMRPHPRGATDD